MKIVDQPELNKPAKVENPSAKKKPTAKKPSATTKKAAKAPKSSKSSKKLPTALEKKAPKPQQKGGKRQTHTPGKGNPGKDLTTPKRVGKAPTDDKKGNSGTVLP